jgi:hypothetical protein
MEYVTFGKTGVLVSRLGFGGAPAGLKNYVREYDPSDNAQRQEQIAAIHKAVECGVTYFDTAPGYGNGISEEIFGEALEPYGDKIFCATKYSIWRGGPVRKSVEQSCRRMRRDTIDLLQIHGTSYNEKHADDIFRPGGILDQMEECREERLIRYIGFTSEDNNDILYRCIRSGRFDMMQVCYNFLNQHPYDPSRPFGSLFEAEERDMGIATMRVPTSGIFQQWIQTVNPENRFNYSPALIQFVLSNPLIDVALIGMRTVDRVIENAAIVNDTDGRISIDSLFRHYP